MQLLFNSYYFPKNTIFSDATTKQTILYINEMNQNRFVIKDLDDTHLLIQPEWIPFVREELDRILEKNVYTLDIHSGNNNSK